MKKTMQVFLCTILLLVMFSMTACSNHVAQNRLDELQAQLAQQQEQLQQLEKAYDELEQRYAELVETVQKIEASPQPYDIKIAKFHSPWEHPAASYLVATQA